MPSHACTPCCRAAVKDKGTWGTVHRLQASRLRWASELILCSAPAHRQHTALRLAAWAPAFVSVYEENARRDGFCTGPINPGVVLDYRWEEGEAARSRGYCARVAQAEPTAQEHFETPCWHVMRAV